MAERITDDDLELLNELGVETTVAPTQEYSARDEHVIAGFEEIRQFVAQHNRLPQHNENGDIFERLYAVRLERLRTLPECRELLAPLDANGLLHDELTSDAPELSDEELLASLGTVPENGSTLEKLVHVRSRAEVNAAEEVAQRAPCPDFDAFKPRFEEVQLQLKNGERQTAKFKDNAAIQLGDWFIVEGQKAFVAEMGEPFVSDYGKPDRRLRVIFDNATQSEMLLRSLQRALNRDKVSRRILEPGVPQTLSLFGEDNEPSSGTIYVLRSNSDHPFIAQHRSLIHKIGVTSGDVESRIANAKQDPTFLLADVEIVATFRLENINRHKLETLLHKFFSSARLDMELKDRFEVPVKPMEWFMVPLPAIEQAVEKINGGTLDQFHYDAEKAVIL
jgi:hypothetical protein